MVGATTSSLAAPSRTSSQQILATDVTRPPVTAPSRTISAAPLPTVPIPATLLPRRSQRIPILHARQAAAVPIQPAPQPRGRPARQIRNLFAAARQPYTEPIELHDLGRMDILCPECGALHWKDEILSKSSLRNPKFGICCMEGKVFLPALLPPPEPLRTLLSSQEREAIQFRQDIWKYNRAFGFTSLGVEEDYNINRNRRGPPVFRISGELHHWSGALAPSEGQQPRYSQLYIYEPQAALDARMNQNAGLNRAVMERLQTMLNEHHEYVPVYKQAYEVLQHYDPQDDVQVRLRLEPRLDQRRYNLPTADEVAVILPGTGSQEPRDIILRQRDGPLQRISELHTAYIPLQYPLLFPRGENQWHPGLHLRSVEEQNRRRNQAAEEGAEDDGDEDGRRLTLLRPTATSLV
ncbi:hypothetical protein BJ912DRAFT_256272 [Pholiota molesta]|nr:hypothetical protein BJ912DRAFT_256272 [Pholiota molesta]